MGQGMKGADQCPKCGSRKTADINQTVTNFYAEILRVCGNCGAAWEPFDPADLLDTDLANSSFVKPCGNCAFRKGSNEQRDSEDWQAKLLLLYMGGRFYCHKGTAITPNNGHGFDYPEIDKIAQKGRLCRGYLNSVVRARLKEEAEPREYEIEGSDQLVPWTDDL
jgi:transcription elongation factor Elf1